MSFLKKKTFSEFKVEQLIAEKANQRSSEDVTVQKTPVTPWMDAKVLPQPPIASAKNQQLNGESGGLSRAKGNRGLMNFFNKDHHEQVINTYGGFSTGMHELNKAKKQVNKTQGQSEIYTSLYEDENDSRGANHASG